MGNGAVVMDKCSFELRLRIGRKVAGIYGIVSMYFLKRGAAMK